MSARSGPQNRQMAMNGNTHHYSDRVLGQVLRRLREAKPLLLTQLAEKTGLCWQCIDDMEKGKTHPLHENVLKLCDGLEISWEDFHRLLYEAAQTM